MEPELRFKGLPRHDKELLQRWDKSMQNSKTKNDFAALLKKVVLFQEAPESFRQQLCDAVVPAEYSGGLLYRQGDPGEWMCIVLSGHLEKSILRDPSLPEIPIGDVAPGGISGDMGMLGVSKVRSHSCRCVEQSSLLLLSRTAFAHLVEATGGLEEHPLLKQLEKMQNLTGDIEAFCDLPCFAKMERECVRKICEFLEPRLYYPGMALMKEGEMGFEMFILHSGKVEVLKGSKVVAELGGGVVLGDVAVLGSDKRRSATVKCLECTLVYVLNGEVVQETLEKFPVTKTVYDHDYIARLLRFELEKAADEVEHLENFYGKCHPMKLDQVSSEIFGRNVDF
ncbi:unnamed protein product [Durusdinium trenchii]|uniref:cGMP-dependent protein kinase egl-4 (Egg-laying defective protein 4) n=2 Tax=Durusdinium trenchii TaxID=1381693 RepID=A0ABP0K4B3_9DINO